MAGILTLETLRFTDLANQRHRTLGHHSVILYWESLEYHYPTNPKYRTYLFPISALLVLDHYRKWFLVNLEPDVSIDNPFPSILSVSQDKIGKGDLQHL